MYEACAVRGVDGMLHDMTVHSTDESSKHGGTISICVQYLLSELIFVTVEWMRGQSGFVSFAGVDPVVLVPKRQTWWVGGRT